MKIFFKNFKNIIFFIINKLRICNSFQIDNDNLQYRKFIKLNI